MNDFGVVYVIVGNRDINHLRHSIKTVKNFIPEIDITVYSDEKINLDVKNILFKKQKFHYREEHRNSSLIRLIALKESKFDVTCYVDNDVYVVSNAFVDGFEIAKNFGIAFPANPRLTIKKELSTGWDVLDCHKKLLEEMPRCFPAFNSGLIFYNSKSSVLIDKAIELQKFNSGRGQANLIQAVWETKIIPCILSRNWLVCEEDLGVEDPISLHVGHKNIFQWYKKEFTNIRYE